MINLIHSEVRKIRSTQVWVWMLLLAIALTCLAAIGPILSASGHDADYYSIFTAAGSAQLALLVLGVLGVTTEFRHKTITPTLLATPSRWRLLIGKAISYTAFAAAYGVICLAVDVVLAVIRLSARGVDVSFGHGVAGGIVKSLINLALMGLFGLGLGAVIRNQAASMVAALAYFFVVDALLRFIPKVDVIFPYTPGGASEAFTSGGHSDALTGGVSLLSPVLGGVVFAGWALALVVLDGLSSLRRDIT